MFSFSFNFFSNWLSPKINEKPPDNSTFILIVALVIGFGILEICFRYYHGVSFILQLFSKQQNKNDSLVNEHEPSTKPLPLQSSVPLPPVLFTRRKKSSLM